MRSVNDWNWKQFQSVKNKFNIHIFLTKIERRAEADIKAIDFCASQWRGQSEM
jgi:hypothetical protein